MFEAVSDAAGWCSGRLDATLPDVSGLE